MATAKLSHPFVQIPDDDCLATYTSDEPFSSDDEDRLPQPKVRRHTAPEQPFMDTGGQASSLDIAMEDDWDTSRMQPERKDPRLQRAKLPSAMSNRSHPDRKNKQRHTVRFQASKQRTKAAPSTRTTHMHQPKVGAVCINHDGYTVSDGTLSLSDDLPGERRWMRRLYDDVQRLGLTKLYLVDQLTERKFKTMSPKPRVLASTDLTDLGSKKTFVQQGKSLEPCEYCMEMRCHRWRVVEYGLRVLVNYALDYIPH